MDGYDYPWPLNIGDKIEVCYDSGAVIRFAEGEVVHLQGPTAWLAEPKEGVWIDFGWHPALKNGHQCIGISDPNVISYAKSVFGWRRVHNAKPVYKDGCVCIKCKARNIYAEPNMPDGSYFCYNCRPYGWKP